MVLLERAKPRLPAHPRYVYLARVGDLRQGAVCGTILNPPGGSHGPLDQSSYQLILVQTGEMLVEAGEQAVRVRAGEVALLLTGQRIFLQCARDRETRHSWLTVEEPLLPPDRMALLQSAPRAQPTSPAMSQLLETGLALWESVEGSALQSALVGLVTAALTLYVEEARTRGELQRQASQHPAVSAVRRLVRQRLHEPLSVAVLARTAHVTPDYLTRLFRRELGLTPMRYVWQERVRRGVEMLEDTGLPVSEVAARAGFQTANHFSRLVRGATGRSPRRVRRERWRST